MNNEKEKLSINVYYPLILLLFSQMIIDNIVVSLLNVMVLNAYLNFTLFSRHGLDFKSNILRTSYLFISNSSLLFTFAYLNFGYGILSGAKIGAVAGFFLNVGLVSYLKKEYNVEINNYFFENSENEYSDVELLKVVVYGVSTVVLIFALLFLIAPQFLFSYFLLIAFGTVFVVSYLYAKRYNAFDKSDLGKKANRYRLGLVGIGISFYMLLQGWLLTIALGMLIAGFCYIQVVTIKEQSELFKKFRNVFILPVGLMFLLIISFSFLIGLSLSNSSSILMSPNEKILFSNISKVDKDINSKVNELFDDLKNKNRLIPEINPVVDIRLKVNNSLFLKKRIDLVGSFTYNYEDVFDYTIHHYKPGKYRLSESDISMAIAESFKLSVYNFFQSYFENGTDVNIYIDGAADAIPFSDQSKTIYRGEYGQSVSSNVYNEVVGGNQKIEVVSGKKIDNEDLAFLRAMGIYDYIENEIDVLKHTDKDYGINIFVESSNVGPKYRKVKIFVEIQDIGVKI